jgi:hypothetical protein
VQCALPLVPGLQANDAQDAKQAAAQQLAEPTANAEQDAEQAASQQLPRATHSVRALLIPMMLRFHRCTSCSLPCSQSP